MHHRVARDGALEARLLGIFVDGLGKLQRVLAGSPAGAQPGTIAFVQRSSRSLTLHFPFHVLALDGVYVGGATSDAPPVCVAAVQTREQLLHLVTTVARRGRLLTVGHVANEDAELAELVQKLFDDADPPPVQEDPKLQAEFHGFDVHAGTTIDADDRDPLERFIRYCMRGPIAKCRLRKGVGDKLMYLLKSRRRNGAGALPPVLREGDHAAPARAPGATLLAHSESRGHLIHFYGVLACHARWRPLIVPASPPTGVKEVNGHAVHAPG